MRKTGLFVGLVAGALAAVILQSDAQQSAIGGVTSRPTFRGVNVSGAFPPNGVILNRTSGTGNVAVEFQRSGAADSFIGIAGAAAGCINDTAAGDTCVRTQGGAVHVSVDSGNTSALTVSSTGNVFTNSNVEVSATDASFYAHDPNAAANEKRWRIYSSLGQWKLETRTDANALGAVAMLADRTGTTVDLINLTATAVQANGVPVATNTNGTFTATYTGMVANDTQTASYTISGSNVCLSIPAGGATSNATTFTITGLPAAVQIPARTGTHGAYQYVLAVDNGVTVNARAFLNEATTSIGLHQGLTTTAWTASGAKSVTNFNLCYTIAP